MLYVEFILIYLFLNFLLDLVDPAIILTVDISALVVILGVIAEQALLGRLEDLLQLFQS